MSEDTNNTHSEDIPQESLDNVEGQGSIVETLSEEEIEETVSGVDTLEEKLNKEKDKFMRLFAEFENYKKRTSRERVELFKTAGQEVIQSLLPVLDDFDRALVELGKERDKDLLKGVELISNKLRDILAHQGLSEIEVKKGDTFDAEKHEAITQIPALNKKMKGKVVDTVEKGYALSDKVIRYPKVVVGQ